MPWIVEFLFTVNGFVITANGVISCQCFIPSFIGLQVNVGKPHVMTVYELGCCSVIELEARI